MGEQKPPPVEKRRPSWESRNLGLHPDFVANLLGHLGQLTFPLCSSVASSVTWDNEIFQHEEFPNSLAQRGTSAEIPIS